MWRRTLASFSRGGEFSPTLATSLIERKYALAKLFCPRISEAQHFLPLLRRQLYAAAKHVPLSSGLRIDLLPIVEDGLFGYELVPDRKAHTYVTIGCNAHGEPMLRKTAYGDGARNALHLVAVEGRVGSKPGAGERYRTDERDTVFPSWVAAAESAFAQLLVLFPDRPRQPAIIRDEAHRCLDEALSVARSYLAQWDPHIHFFGVPNEANLGFGLTGVGAQRGELVFQRPDIWMLRWKAFPDAVYESWSVVLPESQAADTGHLDRAS
jgi:hypothetical protein